MTALPGEPAVPEAGSALPDLASITPESTMPDVVDQVALARLYGEPLFAMPLCTAAR